MRNRGSVASLPGGPVPGGEGGGGSEGGSLPESTEPTPPEPSPPVRLLLDLSAMSDKGMAYVDLPEILSLEEPLTVEMIATPRSVNSAERTKRQQLFGLGNNLISLSQVGSSWVWEVLDSDSTTPKQIAAQSAAQPGVPTHLAGVVARGELRLFVDGRRVGTTLYESPPKAAAGRPTMTLGKSGAASANVLPFDGTLEEVRFSSGARYDRDFLPPKELAADATTLALYHCADGEGERLTDASTSGRHAKIIGGKWQPLPVPAAP
jgi:hypothetical protein